MFRRHFSKKFFSIFLLFFYSISLFQQVALPTQVKAAVGSTSPENIGPKEVPIGTQNGGPNSSKPSIPVNNGIVSVPVPDASNAVPVQPSQSPGNIIIPASKLKTDGTHRMFNLPDNVKGEFLDARTQNSKVFLKNDGTFDEVITTDSLHYKDKNGQWQEIDSRLKESTVSGFDYENTANRFQTLFNGKGINKLLRFQYGKGWIELNPQNRQDSKPEINGDTITYHGIYDGTDLQYIVGSDSLIENLILNNNTGTNTFSYDIKENNLTHQIQNDGSIAFTDKTTGELAFTMAKPYMYDANGEQSENVTMQLQDVNNQTVLTVTADPTWLNSPNRVYPVVIDPDIILKQDVKNTFVRKASDGSYNGTNYNNELDLETGYYTDANNVFNVTSRSYLNFNVQNNIKLANNATVLSAKLTLTRNSYKDQDVPNKVYKVSSGWDPTAITWNNQPSISTDLGVPTTVQNGVFTFDVTSAVNDWLTNTPIGQEYGFSVRSSNETTAGRNFYNSSRYGYNVPQLEVEWTAPYYAGYTADVPSVMLTGQTMTVPVTVSNGGSNPWPATGSNPVTLSYFWEDTAGQAVTVPQIDTSLPHDIQPGEAIQLQASITAPATPGKYKLRIDMHQGTTWFHDQSVPTADFYITTVNNLSGLGIEKFWQYEDDLFKNKINLYNGNLIVHQLLVDLSGRFPVNIDLYYNSRSTATGLFVNG